MEMTTARVNAIVAYAWNTIPHPCDDQAMTPAKAEALPLATKLDMLKGYAYRAQFPENKTLHSADEIQEAIVHLLKNQT